MELYEKIITAYNSAKYLEAEIERLENWKTAPPFSQIGADVYREKTRSAIKGLFYICATSEYAAKFCNELNLAVFAQQEAKIAQLYHDLDKSFARG